MFKKIIGLFLILCLSITCFTGCGKSDIEYLKLVEEIANLEEFEFKSESEILLSDELKELLKDNISENTDIYLSDFGKLNLKMSGVVDAKNHYINVLLSLTDDKELINNETELFITEGGIFISKNSLLNLYSLYLDTNTVFSNQMISEMVNKLSESFSSIEYICLDTTNVFSILDTNNDTIDIEDKIITDFITALVNLDYEKNLDLQLVKKNNKSYTLELNIEDVKEILITYLSFINNRLSKIEELLLSEEHLVSLFGEEYLNYDMLEGESKTIYDSIYVPEYIIYEENIKNITKSLSNLCSEIINYFNDKEKSQEYDNYIQTLKGSKYINILNKKDNVYLSEEKLEIVSEGKTYIEVNTKSSIIIKDVETKIIAGEFIEDFITVSEKISYMINPAEIIECQWTANSRKEIDDIYLEVARKEGTEDLITNYVLREGRLYLPLRKICETFGEEVSWDNINSKAYIIRGNEKIHMTGIIVNGSTFVRIRDFEKLNYDIKYVEGSMVNTVVITKK